MNKWITSGRVKREDLFITTKLPFNANRASSVEKYLKKSLENLQLNYIDLYLIHAPFGMQEGDEILPKDKDGKILLDPTTDHVLLWKTMEDQVDAGRTKSIGVANFNKKQIDRILSIARIPPANLQIELHLYFQQKEMVSYCKSKNIIITSYSSLGSPGTMKRFGKEIPSILENEDVIKISEKHNKTPAQIALRYVIQHGIVVIPKSTNKKRIETNFQITNFTLDEEDVRILTNLDRGEEGRLIIFQEHFPGIETHPEFPFV